MTEADRTDREVATQQMIAERAYKLWEDQGRPDGCDLVHWQQAEQEILSSLEQGPARAEQVPQGTSQTATQSKVAASPAR